MQVALELDGSIMRCVRDQNGNHVIQKCIEFIPQEMMRFIISAFHRLVVELSMHPYGRRVIQRVLEHCNDECTQNDMMEEIMQSVVTLTEHQFGNYVIQADTDYWLLSDNTGVSMANMWETRSEDVEWDKIEKFNTEDFLEVGTPQQQDKPADVMVGGSPSCMR